MRSDLKPAVKVSTRRHPTHVVTVSQIHRGIIFISKINVGQRGEITLDASCRDLDIRGVPPPRYWLIRDVCHI